MFSKHNVQQVASLSRKRGVFLFRELLGQSRSLLRPGAKQSSLLSADDLGVKPRGRRHKRPRRGNVSGQRAASDVCPLRFRSRKRPWRLACRVLGGAQEAHRWLGFRRFEKCWKTRNLIRLTVFESPKFHLHQNNYDIFYFSMASNIRVTQINYAA